MDLSTCVVTNEAGQVVNFGDLVTDFSGAVGTFEGVTRLPLPGKTAKVVVDNREAYATAWGLTVSDPAAPQPAPLDEDQFDRQVRLSPTIDQLIERLTTMRASGNFPAGGGTRVLLVARAADSHPDFETVPLIGTSSFYWTTGNYALLMGCADPGEPIEPF